MPGGPVIDTPKNHQRRELAVPAFVVQLLVHKLGTVAPSWVADSHGVLVAARPRQRQRDDPPLARAVDGRDAEVAQHLDASRAKEARRSGGTQRARKPRKAEK
ncbi:hypothetical protein D7193_08510 [Micromonospora costi]|uniref:Uncharacterized protein n=1 Tax=Micromonospora costi TaxID=1530042 RepID=A0A3B0ADW5_9ACTN|nr:hypothetical protein D7193_08510 [Micromonospora costi]